jgi:tRNA-splicing ligase RtcB (3'-phosphate/5'-hydroxy nucleic acid ligase)
VGILPGWVVSTGGVGFDISCGVRLLAADVGRDGLARSLAGSCTGLTPCGAGPGAHGNCTAGRS